MRCLLRVAVCFLLVLPLAGCFVLDELDSGAAIMDAHSPNRKSRETAAQQEKNAKEAEGAPMTLAEKKSEARKWWDSATTVSSRESDAEDPTVHCRTGGSMLFMRRSACLARGGKPGR